MIKTLCLPLLLVLSLNSAGAQTTSAIPLKNQENTMSDKTPTISKVMHTLLQVIDNLHNRQDFTPDKIGPISGFEMAVSTNDPHVFYAGEQLTPEWGYGYELDMNMAASPDHHYSLLIFNFLPVDSDAWPSMTDICTPDLDAFHNMLLAIGFENTSSVMGKHGLYQSYRRQNIKLNDGISIDVHYYGENSQTVTHKCIRSVWIYSPNEKGMK